MFSGKNVLSAADFMDEPVILEANFGGGGGGGGSAPLSLSQSSSPSLHDMIEFYCRLGL